MLTIPGHEIAESAHLGHRHTDKALVPIKMLRCSCGGFQQMIVPEVDRAIVDLLAAQHVIEAAVLLLYERLEALFAIVTQPPTQRQGSSEG